MKSSCLQRLTLPRASNTPPPVGTPAGRRRNEREMGVECTTCTPSSVAHISRETAGPRDERATSHVTRETTTSRASPRLTSDHRPLLVPARRRDAERSGAARRDRALNRYTTAISSNPSHPDHRPRARNHHDFARIRPRWSLLSPPAYLSRRSPVLTNAANGGTRRCVSFWVRASIS